MMRYVGGVLRLLAAGSLFVATVAQAKHPITERARRNVDTRITEDFRIDDSCHSVGDPPTAVVLVPPRHGDLRQEVVHEALSAARLHTDQKFACEGKPIYIRYIYYKSRGSYRGPDSFKIEWNEAGERTQSDYDLQVR